MDMGALLSAAEGFGIAAAGGFAGWQAWKARKNTADAKATTEQVQRSMSTNNGGSHAKDQWDRIERAAIEARNAARQANEKIDRHLEAHADAHLAGVRPVVVVKEVTG